MDCPSHIPYEIWNAAVQMSPRFSSYEEILSTAEYYLKRIKNEEEPIDERKIKWQPFLSYMHTRIIKDALDEYDTPIEEDLSELVKLREWFS